MNDLNVEQITNIMFHQLSEDDRDFIVDNFTISQAMLLIGNKNYRNEAIATQLKYIQFLEKLDMLHNSYEIFERSFLYNSNIRNSKKEG